MDVAEHLLANDDVTESSDYTTPVRPTKEGDKVKLLLAPDAKQAYDKGYDFVASEFKRLRTTSVPCHRPYLVIHAECGDHQQPAFVEILHLINHDVIVAVVIGKIFALFHQHAQQHSSRIVIVLLTGFFKPLQIQFKNKPNKTTVFLRYTYCGASSGCDGK